MARPHQDFSLRRCIDRDGAPLGSRPPTRAAAAAYTIEPADFTTAGVTLSGTLSQAKQPFAAAVIVHGSGQEERMRDFAAILASSGITTLTYDKRGVGKSGGVFAGPEVGTNDVDATTSVC
jgi:hypothetical protein